MGVCCDLRRASGCSATGGRGSIHFSPFVLGSLLCWPPQLSMTLHQLPHASTNTRLPAAPPVLTRPRETTPLRARVSTELLARLCCSPSAEGLPQIEPLPGGCEGGECSSRQVPTLTHLLVCQPNHPTKPDPSPTHPPPGVVEEAEGLDDGSSLNRGMWGGGRPVRCRAGGGFIISRLAGADGSGDSDECLVTLVLNVSAFGVTVLLVGAWKRGYLCALDRALTTERLVTLVPNAGCGIFAVVARFCAPAGVRPAPLGRCVRTQGEFLTPLLVPFSCSFPSGPGPGRLAVARHHAAPGGAHRLCQRRHRGPGGAHAHGRHAGGW